MHIRSCLLFACLAAGVTNAGIAADYSPRQYYSGWQSHPQRQYQYRHYYYKPNPNYSGYKHHYVVLPKKDPKHLYYYNPYTKKYWGRCPVNSGGQPHYSLLAENHRKAKLDEIPESAFPQPGQLPPIPESNDGALLDLPPDDLPEGALP
jgi:hypothetical protein